MISMLDQASKLRKMVEKEGAAGKEEKSSDNSKIIAVASGKGGVGKSNITVNLGLALKEAGQEVLLIDADMGMANLDILLGLAQKYNLSHILQDKCTFEEALISGPEGIDILPGTSGVEDFVNINQNQVKRLLKVASQMEANYDIILIDIGAGIHRSVINFIIGADEAYIVLTPEPTAVMDAYSLVKILSTHRQNNFLGLIINQIDSRKQARELGNRMSEVIEEYLSREIKVRGYIPHDPYLKKAVKKQQPLLSLYPDSKASQAFKDLAGQMLAENGDKPARGARGFVYRLIGMFNRG